MRKLVLIVSLLLAGCVAPSKVEKSMIYEGDAKAVEKMLAHGTGVVYLGFEECPWCVQYRPLLEEMAMKSDIEVMHYDVHADKKDDRDQYDRIASRLNEMDDSILRYDNDGNAVIYMPLTVFVKEGKLLGYENETCDLSSKEQDPKTYWTVEKKQSLEDRILPLMDDVKAARDEKNTQGCAIKEDSGC